MSIQFPANPPLNDTFDYDGKTYIWDGEKWTASAIGSFDEAYVNIDGDTMTGDLTVPSLNGGPLAGMRNALINGDFRVWQRGAADTPVPTDFPTYRADRWFVRRQGQTGGTPRQGYYKINTNKYGHEYQATGLTSSAYVSQIVESTNCQHLSGQTVTFSIYANAAPTLALEYRDSNGNPVNVPGTTVSLGDNRYSLTVTLPDVQIGAGFNQQGLQVLCWYNGKQDPLADGLWRTWDAQLEVSPVATPFEMRPIGTELALCQRYYHQNTGQFARAPLTNSNTGDKSLFYRYPQTMRITPIIDGLSVNAGTISTAGTTASSTEIRVSGSNSSTNVGISNGTFDAEL